MAATTPSPKMKSESSIGPERRTPSIKRAADDFYCIHCKGWNKAKNVMEKATTWTSKRNGVECTRRARHGECVKCGKHVQTFTKRGTPAGK